MNLLIYYNPHQCHFYVVYTNHLPFNKEVGFVNSFDHILVQILINRNGKLYNVNSYCDLHHIPYEKEKLKIRLINRLIRWLNKLKRG